MNYFPTWALPNGKVLRRGDAVLVPNGAELATAFINQFRDDDGDGWPEMSVVIMTTGDHGGGSSVPIWDSKGQGIAVRYDGDPYPKGLRCCLPEDGEEACLRVMQFGKQEQSEPVVEASVDSQSADTADLPEPTCDPADKDHDGTVSKAERKEWKREQRGE